MSDFEPGEGWRLEKRVPGHDKTKSLVYTDGDGTRYVYLREESVPPLPTEEHTVIRPHWVKRNRPCLPLTLGRGADPAGELTWDGLTPEHVAERITGFEVLASPMVTWSTWEILKKRVRRETAKAVIDRFRRGQWLSDGTLEEIAREFEVES